MTKRQLLAAVPGAKPHDPDVAIRQGVMDPPAVHSGRRDYGEKQRLQLEDYVRAVRRRAAGD